MKIKNTDGSVVDVSQDEGEQRIQRGHAEAVTDDKPPVLKPTAPAPHDKPAKQPAPKLAPKPARNR